MKATKDKGRGKAQEMVRTGQHNRIAKENRRPGKPPSKKNSSRGRKNPTKSDDENMQKTIIRKAMKYHKLKREVLAPFIAELLVIKFFDEIKANLDTEASISHTFVEGINSDDENSNRESASPAPSFHDDWRQDQSPFSESD